MKIDVLGPAEDCDNITERTHVTYTITIADDKLKNGKNGRDSYKTDNWNYGYTSEISRQARCMRHDIKDELSEYNRNKERYLDIYAPPYRDLKELKNKMIDPNDYIPSQASVIKKYNKNKNRRKAYRTRKSRKSRKSLKSAKSNSSSVKGKEPAL